MIPKGFVFSQSNLQSYVNCPYQFYLRYVIGLKWPGADTANQSDFEKDMAAGSRFHQLLHQYFIGIDSQLLRQTAKNDPDLRLAGWFDAFTHQFNEILQGRLFPEHTIQSRIDNFPVMAKYDLLQINKKRYTIYDWKTSRNVPSDTTLQNRIQTRVFPFVLANSLLGSEGFESYKIRMVYWEVSKPSSPFLLDYSRDKYDQDRSFLLNMITTLLANNNFLKTKDIRSCRYCLYRSHCNRGVLAGDLMEMPDDFTSPKTQEQDDSSFDAEI